VPRARFDDLPAGRAVELRATRGVLRADRLEDVEPVLDAADAHAAAGRWAFGFVAYESAPAFDPGLAVHPGLDGLPLAWFGLADDATTTVPVRAPRGHGYTAGPWTVRWTREQHRDAVEAVRARIADGETYQVNLTTALTGPVTGDLVALYADLATAQGGAHNAFLDTGRFVVVGSSDWVSNGVLGRELTMRPMNGTAPRGTTPDDDRRRAEALRTSAKERAENVMIVDLVRNDLARLAAAPGPRVTELCTVETYPTVHQLTSQVVARTRDEAGLVDVFRQLNPHPSVTGAPKHRTMQVIRELEDGPRGVYCGAVGVVPPAGSGLPTRFDVPYRTLLVDRVRGTGRYGVGGGITWGSDPDAEYDELLAKARVLPGADPVVRS
jgi:para-aminobenzoate synthetase/4-amino-4-deoxychorismate lyase